MPYQLVMGTAGCAEVLAVLNQATVSPPTGLMGRVQGTVPTGTARGDYSVCFRSISGPLTATGVATFDAT